MNLQPMMSQWLPTDHSPSETANGYLHSAKVSITMINSGGSDSRRAVRTYRAMISRGHGLVLILRDFNHNSINRKLTGFQRITLKSMLS
jgi:hypothetical protein